jgi:hypothetical protein
MDVRLKACFTREHSDAFSGQVWPLLEPRPCGGVRGGLPRSYGVTTAPAHPQPIQRGHNSTRHSSGEGPGVTPQCGRTLASRTVRLSVKSVWTISDVRHHGPDTLAPLARVSGLSDVDRHASSRTHTLTRTHACTHATDMGGIQPSQLPTHTRVGSEWGEIHSQHAPRATQRNAMDMRNAHSPDRQRYRVVPFHAGCQPTRTARAHHCPPPLSPSLIALPLSPSPSLSRSLSLTLTRSRRAAAVGPPH